MGIYTKMYAYFDKKVGKTTVWDMALYKNVFILLGLIVGAYISGFVKQYIWYFVGVLVVGYVVAVFRFFKK